ncbi:MAG: FIVAR domain-containing protein [Clostridiales Family XIII bacterium]|nr:FIVAR domain-containing protein [Clostridiales Family XIII bacterium]
MQRSAELTVSVTKDAAFHLYSKIRHYYPFVEYTPKSKTTDDEYDIYTFMVASQMGYHYEAGGGDYLKEVQIFTIRPDYDRYHIDIDLKEKLDNHIETTPNAENGTPESNLLLNTDDGQYIELLQGGIFDLYPLRVRQAQLNLTSNYFAEPDFHFEVIDGETGESETLDSFHGGKASKGSISIGSIGSRGREEYRITGLRPGVSIIKITYDALILRTNIETNSNDVKNVDFARHYFNPNEENNTAIVVVNVAGAYSSGIDLNIAASGERGAEGEDDTVYFADSEDGVDFTFAPTSAINDNVSVRVHDPLFRDTAWEDEWTNYGEAASGSDFTVRLKDGRNIVEVSSGDAVKYHVINAKAIPITITNQEKSDWEYGDTVEVGDEIQIDFLGVNIPVPKLSGIYNPDSRYVEYKLNSGESVKSSGGPYGHEIAGVEFHLDFTIPWPGETTLSDGKILEYWWGDKWGNHRAIPALGRNPNLSAAYVQSSPYHSMLPDLHFYTNPEEEGEDAIVTFTMQEEGTTLVVKTYQGFTKTPDEDGVYTINIGNGHKYYYYKPGYYTKTAMFRVEEGGTTITLPPFTDDDKVNQSIGKVSVSVITNDALLRNEQAVDFDIENLPNISQYVEYGYGGYTVLHALIGAFKDSNLPFSASEGKFVPNIDIGSGSAGSNAGWVCRLNDKTVISDFALSTTLVKDGDKIVYYYNAANSGQLYMQFLQSTVCPGVSVARGEKAVFDPRTKPAGTSADGWGAIRGAKLYIDGHDSGIEVDGYTRLTIDTEDLSLGPHILTLAYSQPLTYARAILTVTKPDDAAPSGVTFRLIGAKKHEGQSGYGRATVYENWIQTATYPLASGKTATVGTIFNWALGNAGLSFKEPTSNYIQSIAAPASLGGYSLSETDNGPNAGWMFTVNGVHQDVGLRSAKVSPGDEIVFHYADDYTRETGMMGTAVANLPYPFGWLRADDSNPNDDTAAVNKKALAALIADAEKLKEADCTKESWAEANLAGALEKAKEANGNADATQQEVDEAYAALDTAVGTLEKAPEAAEPPVDDTAKAMLNSTLSYLYKNTQNPAVSSVGGEWAVFALARAGALGKDDPLYAKYLENLKAYVKEGAYSVDTATGKVQLHRTKYTENARVVLALTALGIDAADFDGYDFVSALLDKDGSGYRAAGTGANGVIYALIALDSGGYCKDTEEGKAARAWYLEYLIAKQNVDGSWSLGAGGYSDDTTAMALQAIAPYYRNGTAQYEALSIGETLEILETEAATEAETPQAAEGPQTQGDTGANADAAANIGTGEGQDAAADAGGQAEPPSAAEAGAQAAAAVTALAETPDAQTETPPGTQGETPYGQTETPGAQSETPEETGSEPAPATQDDEPQGEAPEAQADTAVGERPSVYTQEEPGEIVTLGLPAPAPAYEQIKTAVERAVAWLSARYLGAGLPDAESIAQAIVAMTELGIDPKQDERFVKDGQSLYDALLDYRDEYGGFRHDATGSGDEGMSSEQAAYALVALARYEDKARPLYDMAEDAFVWTSGFVKPAVAGDGSNKPVDKDKDPDPDTGTDEDPVAKETVNRSRLEAAITQARGLNGDLYSTVTWRKLTSALGAAEAAWNDQNATQAQIDKAADNLLAAISGLKAKTDLPDVDKVKKAAQEKQASLTVLDSMIALAKSLDSREYTGESWAALQKALEAAEKVSANSKNATQKEIDTAKDALIAAIGALELIAIGETATPQSGFLGAGTADTGAAAPQSAGARLTARGIIGVIAGAAAAALIVLFAYFAIIRPRMARRKETSKAA